MNTFKFASNQTRIYLIKLILRKIMTIGNSNNFKESVNKKPTSEDVKRENVSKSSASRLNEDFEDQEKRKTISKKTTSNDSDKT